jgi:hypothetical protein
MPVIWKDQYDETICHIGVAGSLKPSNFFIRTTLNMNVISDLFGREAMEWAEKLAPGVVTEIALFMK